MDYGLCLPNFRAGASPEGIEAGADVAGRLGWSTVWTTDHVLVDHASVDEYGRIYEAMLVLAWVGARHPGLRLGTSVIVVPQRNAVLLAKELATLDGLSGGRLTVGVGIGWNRTEFGNLGLAERFGVRGAYLDETIALWRHLWSGSREPFHGRFHTIDDFEFEPLPVQSPLPIVIGGRAEPALQRVGRVGRRLSLELDLAGGVRRAAAGHPGGRGGGRTADAVALGAGERGLRPDRRTRRIRCAGRRRRSPPRSARSPTIGVTHLALAFGTTDAAEVVARAERFAREVAPLV